MSEQQAPPSVPPAASVDPDRPRAPLRWWVEILLTLAFYAVYSAIRNQFGSALGESIKDVVESSTDPRSPLKIQAACRENLVATKFVSLEEVLASAPRKKKLYTNERVLAAAEKEKEKKERMERDENERLAALFQMEQQAAGGSKE